MIPAQVIEQIRSRIDPVEVIGRRVELRKTGASFSAPCPFHADRTPSFRVYPDSKRFKCFGCGARGDAFEFLRRFEGKDFRTVVLELAAEVGVAVPDGAAPPPTTAGPGRQALERACEAALAHWMERLWGPSGGEARRYLQARGIEEATARQFRLGWAPRDWHDLQAGLAAFSTEDLTQAGLLGASKQGDAPYDRFRGRIIFPFAQLDRRVVGFGGRLVAPAGDGHADPRYLNSPETPIFRKGHLLFGLGEAQAAIRITRRALLVEGYVDALAVHQAGVREVVAAGGTALTEQQVALLQRCGCEELVLLLDGDAAGVEAPGRLAPTLLRSGLAARVARLPGGTDPDTFLRAHGAHGLTGLLDAAKPLTEWLLERTIAARTTATGTRGLSVEQKLLIVRDLRPHVSAMRPGLPRALFEQRIARRLELYIIALRAELARTPAGPGRQETGHA
jgi:DNA primase